RAGGLDDVEGGRHDLRADAVAVGHRDGSLVAHCRLLPSTPNWRNVWESSCGYTECAEGPSAARVPGGPQLPGSSRLSASARPWLGAWHGVCAPGSGGAPGHAGPPPRRPERDERCAFSASTTATSYAWRPASP